jgi:hypothetical protein
MLAGAARHAAGTPWHAGAAARVRAGDATGHAGRASPRHGPWHAAAVAWDGRLRSFSRSCYPCGVVACGAATMEGVEPLSCTQFLVPCLASERAVAGGSRGSEDMGRLLRLGGALLWNGRIVKTAAYWAAPCSHDSDFAKEHVRAWRTSPKEGIVVGTREFVTGFSACIGGGPLDGGRTSAWGAARSCSSKVCRRIPWLSKLMEYSPACMQTSLMFCCCECPVFCPHILWIDTQISCAVLESTACFLT